MNIQESNKLIAEFVGLEKANCDIPLYVVGDIGYPANKLEYHKSWDWLMPVVRKIDQVCGIDLHEWGEYLNYALRTKELSVVHGAVVEFIIWYNQNKQP